MTKRQLAAFWLLIGVLGGDVARGATADDLRRIENKSTVRLTTIGRTSGLPRTVTVWFLHDAGRLYVQSGKQGQTDWYRNLLKNSEVTLDFDGLVLRGRAVAVDDPAEVAHVHQGFRSKYLTARVTSWFGKRFGLGKVVRIDALERVSGGPSR